MSESYWDMMNEIQDGKFVYYCDCSGGMGCETCIPKMKQKQLKLHLGCGEKKIPGWVNIDIRPDVEPDLVWDLNQPLPNVWNGKVDIIFSCHNLEHYKRNQLDIILKDWYSMLKPGGILRLSVPDFEAIVKHYIYHQDLPKLYGLLHGGLKNDYDVHFVSFDFKTLSRKLKNIGFKSVQRYDRWKTEHSFIDDYSAATLDPPFSRDGLLMSLNIEAVK